MAEKVIFQEQELILTGSSSVYSLESAPALFVLEEGETYRVVLDGTEYELVCISDEGYLNLQHVVLEESGEATSGSFSIMYASAELTGTEGGGSVVMVIDSTNSATHTLAIYQVTAEEVGIITRDYTGEETVHYGLETLEADTTDGGTQKFVREDLVPEVVENIPVVLDLSGGDQTITAPEGMAVKSAIIQKPETLIPDNIAEGVDIAAIIGTLAAGGGSGKVAWGTLKSSGSAITVEHGLGCVPDAIIILRLTSMNGSTSFSHGGYGLSKAFATKLGTSVSLISFYKQSSSSDPAIKFYSGYMEELADKQYYTIWGVTDTVFCTPAYMDTSNTYLWVAVGGLT